MKPRMSCWVNGKANPAAPIGTPGEDEAVAVLNLINSERASRKLPPLALHPALLRSAKAHSDDMAARHLMTHYGAGGSPDARMKAAGYHTQWSGECVGWNYQTPADIVSGWMGDAPHRAILLGPHYTHVGAAETNLYWTADFANGEPNSPAPAPLDRSDFDPW